jgi:glutathione S-transferase
MAPHLHLYMTAGSCALASHIALQESGLAFTTTDLNAHPDFPAEHLHLNPQGKVPILQLDSEYITETAAILSTVAALAPEKKLLGSTVLEQARAHEWIAYLSGTLHAQGFGCMFRPAKFAGDEEQVHNTVKALGRDRVEDCFSFIDGKLEGRMWAVDEDFTAVDAYMYVFWRWTNMLKLGAAEKYPNYGRLVDRVVTRESVKRVIEAEGITFDGSMA